MKQTFIANDLQPKIDKIKPTLAEMGIEPNKGKCEIKDVVQMAETIGLAVSPSQAIEALYFAKGDVEKFKSPLNDLEFKRFLQWFSNNKAVLRLKSNNFMKINRKHQNSITVRPSINIGRSNLDSPTNSPRSKFKPNKKPFSPHGGTYRIGTKTPVDEIAYRAKVQVKSLSSHLLEYAGRP